MSKGGGQTTTVQNQSDPRTLQFREQFRRAALSNLQRDNPALQRAFSGLLGGLGAAGERGLGGIEAFQDPFESQVVAGVQGDIDRALAENARRAADVATREGAFGGSRSAILEAEGARDINQLGAQQLANIRSQGFNQAVRNLLNERSRLGSLGLAGAQGLLGLDAQRLAALHSLVPGLVGDTTQTQTVEQQNDLFGQLLGLGLGVGGLLIGGPGGAAVGSQLGSTLSGGFNGGQGQPIGIGGRFSFN